MSDTGPEKPHIEAKDAEDLLRRARIDRCPPAEMISAYAENTLPEASRRAVTDHVALCEICAAAANAVHPEPDSTRMGWPSWRVAAAAAAVVVMSLGLWIWLERREDPGAEARRRLHAGRVVEAAAFLDAWRSDAADARDQDRRDARAVAILADAVADAAAATIEPPPARFVVRDPALRPPRILSPIGPVLADRPALLVETDGRDAVVVLRRIESDGRLVDISRIPVPAGATPPALTDAPLVAGRYHLLCRTGDLADSVTFTVLPKETRRRIDTDLRALDARVRSVELRGVARAAFLAREGLFCDAVAVLRPLARTPETRAAMTRLERAIGIVR